MKCFTVQHNNEQSFKKGKLFSLKRLKRAHAKIQKQKLEAKQTQVFSIYSQTDQQHKQSILFRCVKASPSS